jgi:hypothetical protein
MAQSIQHDPPTLIARISAARAANIHRPSAQPGSASTHPVVSIRLVQNIRQVNGTKLNNEQDVDDVRDMYALCQEVFRCLLRLQASRPNVSQRRKDALDEWLSLLDFLAKGIIAGKKIDGGQLKEAFIDFTGSPTGSSRLTWDGNDRTGPGLRRAHAIVFIDEFEALVPSRETLGGYQDYKSSEVNEFLTHLNSCSKKNIFIVAATNQPEKIDAAVRRTGRLDKLIYVGPPDEEARREMLALHLDPDGLVPSGARQIDGLAGGASTVGCA